MIDQGDNMTNQYKTGRYDYVKETLDNIGGAIVDISILNKNIIHLSVLFFDEEGNEGSIILSYNKELKERNWIGEGTGQLQCSLAIDPQYNELVIIEESHLLTVSHKLDGSELGEIEMTGTIQDTNIIRFRRSGIQKVKTILDHVYACGGQGTVFRRDKNTGYWTDLSIPIGNNNSDKVVENSILKGIYFEDIDGFSINDLYVCGEKGNFWHYDGKNWRDIDLPTMSDLTSVCCAPHGIVFVGGKNGELWMGKGNKWHPITGEFVSDIRAMTWYNDMLLVGTKLEFKTFDHDKGTFEELNSLFSAVHMSKSPDEKYLIVGGSYQLVLFEGTEVTPIISW